MNAPRQFIGAITAAFLSKRKMLAQYGVLTVVGEPTIAGRRRVYNPSVADACMSRPFVRDAARPVVRDSWDKAFAAAREMQETQAWKVA